MKRCRLPGAKPLTKLVDGLWTNRLKNRWKVKLNLLRIKKSATASQCLKAIVVTAKGPN